MLCATVNVDRCYVIMSVDTFMICRLIKCYGWIEFFFCHHLQIKENYEGRLESEFTVVINQRQGFNS